jgi:hypothetical protein
MASSQEQQPTWVPASGIQEAVGRDIEIASQLLDGIDPDAIQFRAHRWHHAVIRLGGLNSLVISEEETFPDYGGDEIRETATGTWIVHTSPDGTWKTSRDTNANRHNLRNGGLTIAGGAFVNTKNPDPTQRAKGMGRAIGVARQAIRYHNIQAAFHDKSIVTRVATGTVDAAVLSTIVGTAAYGLIEQNPAALMLDGVFMACFAANRLSMSRLKGQKNALFDPAAVSTRPYRAVAANMLLRTALVRVRPEAT